MTAPFIKVTTKGFDKIKQGLLRFADRDLPAAKVRVAAKIRDEAPSVMRGVIQGNKANVAPLASSTVRRRSGTGRQPLYDTTRYAYSWAAKLALQGNSIGVDVTPTGSTFRTGVTHAQLVAMLEHGTRKMVARPHIGVFVSLMQERMMKHLQKEVRRGLSRNT